MVPLASTDLAGPRRRAAKRAPAAVTRSTPRGHQSNRFIYGSRTNTPEMIIQYTNPTGTPPTPTAVYRIFSDHLGSPRYVVDATGAVVWQASYSAFGKRNWTGSKPEDFIPFGFAGGLYDPDTKLTHFGARDYDARFGRWVSNDPACERSSTSTIRRAPGATKSSMYLPAGT